MNATEATKNADERQASNQDAALTDTLSAWSQVIHAAKLYFIKQKEVLKAETKLSIKALIICFGLLFVGAGLALLTWCFALLAVLFGLTTLGFSWFVASLAVMALNICAIVGVVTLFKKVRGNIKISLPATNLTTNFEEH